MGACRMLFSARWWNKSPHTHDSSLRSLKRKKYVNYLSFSFATQPRVWAIAIRPLSRAINIFSRSFAAFLCRLCTHFFFHSRRKTRIMPAEAESQKGGKEKRRKKIDGRNVVTWRCHSILKSHRRITLMTNYRGRMSRLKKISVRKCRDSLKRSLAWPDDAFDVRWWRDDSQVLFILPSRLVGHRLTTSCLSVILELPPPSISLLSRAENVVR